jgi:hypothetical protein
MMSESAHRSLWNITCLLIGGQCGLHDFGSNDGAAIAVWKEHKVARGRIGVSIAGA